MKIRIFESMDEINKYLILDKDIIKTDEHKSTEIIEEYVVKGDFSSVNGFRISKDTEITKFIVTRANAIEKSSILVKGIPTAVVTDEQIKMFCILKENNE
jgi:hypothetical protein